MSRNKHSYVAFYMDAWMGGTFRMTRLVRSVYFDVCLHNWDKVEAMSEADQMLAFDDLGPQGPQIVNVLVATGKLTRNADGSVFNEKAMEEASKAFELWAKKSGGGKKGAAVTNAAGTPDGTPAVTPVADKTRLDKNPTDEEGRASPSLSSGDDGEGAPADADQDDKPEKPVRKTYAVEPIAEAWNAMAAMAKGIAPIRKLSEERRKKIRARLDDYTEAEMVEAINLIPQRPFCMGQNDRKWFADIDFLVRPNTVTKILEGTAYQGSGGAAGWAGA